jgi:hypothetical protein
MEQILWLYAQPYDARHPVICFDERPCFLIGERLAPLPLQAGQAAKEHYAYIKNGSCALLGAIEPLTGKRLAEVYPQRTMLEYTRFCQAMVTRWPEAETIRLVQDNLNTHSIAAFYKYLPADQAFALAQKFEFCFTPKSASWLNMIEIEFSAISRQCLNRRIPTIDELRSEVLAIVKDRDAKRIKIDWQFSISDARYKMRSHYQRVNPANNVHQNT